MNLMTMELVLPMLELHPQKIMDIFNCIGATPAGSYAVLDSQYGNGARMAGPLVKINDVLCTWSWCSELSKLSVKPFVRTPDCFMVEEFCVTVYGAASGDTILFKDDADAKDWLSRLSSIEQLKLTVKSVDYNGSAVMYLSTHNG